MALSTNQTEQNNEISTMTWSTATRGNITGSFYVHPTFFTGYISGAQFFTLNTITYAVIARYYDPVADTHELDCAVIQFNEQKVYYLLYGLVTIQQILFYC